MLGVGRNEGYFERGDMGSFLSERRPSLLKRPWTVLPNEVVDFQSWSSWTVQHLWRCGAAILKAAFMFVSWDQVCFHLTDCAAYASSLTVCTPYSKAVQFGPSLTLRRCPSKDRSISSLSLQTVENSFVQVLFIHGLINAKSASRSSLWGFPLALATAVPGH